jgi:hypothetical protein
MIIQRGAFPSTMDIRFKYLKRGPSRKLPEDRLGPQDGYSAFKTNLKNLRPFIARH